MKTYQLSEFLDHMAERTLAQPHLKPVVTDCYAAIFKPLPPGCSIFVPLKEDITAEEARAFRHHFAKLRNRLVHYPVRFWRRQAYIRIKPTSEW